jgi:hypothetical protein
MAIIRCYNVSSGEMVPFVVAAIICVGPSDAHVNL